MSAVWSPVPSTDCETLPLLVPSTPAATVVVPADDASRVDDVVDVDASVGAVTLDAVSSDDAVLVAAGARLPVWIMKLFALAYHEPSMPAYLIGAALNGTTASTWSLTD